MAKPLRKVIIELEHRMGNMDLEVGKIRKSENPQLDLIGSPWLISQYILHDL